MGTRQRLPLGRALLGFLMGESMHGYDLHQRVERELGEIWYMGISNIYGALKRLEKQGLVDSAVRSQGSRPARKVHSITPAGEQSFLDWVRTPVASMRDMRVEFPTKLYFYRSLGLEGAEDLISGQEKLCRQRIESLEHKAARRAPHDFDRLVFDFRRRQIEAIVGWIQVCREQFATVKP
jgi:DNA-binding PadR family transcriptional regulator